MDKNSVQTATFTVTNADADLGSAIAAGMIRFIYRVKWINEFAGANLLTLGKRENGAGVTTTLDVFQAALQYDQDADPDELTDDSDPLYSVGGAGATGASYLRGGTDNGNMYVTIWYEDAPAPT
jgi:hypothetical protein